MRFINKRSIPQLSCLFLSVLMFSCTSSEKQYVESSKKEISIDKIDSLLLQKKEKPSIVLDHFYNEISMFIAGLPIDTSSRFYKMSSSSEYENYAKTIDRKFSKFKSRKLSPLRTWRDSSLLSINNSTENVLYPFSGPDIIYAYSIFPTAKNYYLFGLEPTGIIPNIEDYKTDLLPEFFSTLSSSIRDNLSLSFFITKKMKTQLNNSEIKGTIPILLFFMSRLNLHIQDIKPVYLDSNGLIVSNDEINKKTTKRIFKTGVDISFVRPNEDIVSHVYYFSMNINNRGLDDYSPLNLFLNSLTNKTSTLVKSASFCMHEKKYSRIKNILLNVSDAIIQDDSGIPYKFFDLDIWNINLYGSYSQPISVFKNYLQRDYKDAFRKDVKPINFRFGYSNPSNILVATKIQNLNKN